MRLKSVKTMATINLVIEAELKEKIVAMAKREDRSVTGLLRWLVLKELERMENKG